MNDAKKSKPYKVEMQVSFHPESEILKEGALW